MKQEQSNPYLSKDGDRLIITDEGHAYLRNILTDTQGPVYVFRDSAPAVFVASSMARLSRRGSDLREIYLDEFAMTGPDKAENLLQRVITQYGDDSVQQLLVLSFVVEDASNILTKKLEWGRLAAYLEQSTRYIYYDQRNRLGHYRYFVPQGLTHGLEIMYRKTMNEIFDLYSLVVHSVTAYLQKNIPEPQTPQEKAAWKGALRAQACDAARPMLPAATTSTVGIVASAQSIESLILHLEADPLQESQKIGLAILREARKVAPVFFQRADMPSRGGAWVMHRMDTQKAIRDFAKQYLPVGKELLSQDAVTLLDYWPKDEFELIPELLFSEADEVPLEVIFKEVASWPKDRKLEALQRYVGQRLNRRHKPGRAFEKVHYEWQITADYGTFRDLQRHRIVDAFEWQRLTPVYGYDVPERIRESGFQEPFQKVFELSSRLYRLLRNEGFEEEAQYATLLGHRMRYRFLLNLRASFHFHELRTSPQGHPGYRKIVQCMHEKLCSVHPHLGKFMRFVSMDEDPELTRYAAELASKRKLQILSRK